MLRKARGSLEENVERSSTLSQEKNTGPPFCLVGASIQVSLPTYSTLPVTPSLPCTSKFDSNFLLNIKPVDLKLIPIYYSVMVKLQDNVRLPKRHNNDMNFVMETRNFYAGQS